MVEDDSLEKLIELFMMEDDPSISSKQEKILSREVDSEFERKINYNSEEIKQLKKDFKNLIKQLENNNSHNLKKTKGHTLKKELAMHAKEFDFLRCLIMTGDTYCEIEGVVFKLYTDFVILLAEGNRLIKIPLDKIVALEEKKGSKKKMQKSLQDDNQKDSATEKTKETDKIKAIKRLSV